MRREYDFAVGWNTENLTYVCIPSHYIYNEKKSKIEVLKTLEF